jgi:hypothetical protein
MNNEEKSPREARKQKGKKTETEKKKVETLLLGLRILHGSIKCSFRRGIMGKNCLPKQPCLVGWG